jgi:tetratricopeptide (TPR) repeat protein
MRANYALLLTACACTLLTLCVRPAYAQHPIDVQRLSAEGEHMRALLAFEALPDRTVTAETRLAAAKSCWALGLNAQSAEHFDIVLREKQLPIEARARVTLSRGVLEYQEQRFSESALYAEKAISYMKESSPLRARAYLLWGQSLVGAKIYATADDKLSIALTEAAPEDKPEIHYALGQVRMKVGKFSEAEKHFESIPTDHDRSAAAVRALAVIALETKQTERANVWLQKGKAEYADAFLDSWADYGLVQVALARNDLSLARTVVERAAQQFPPSDSWLILMQATLESAEWDRKEKIKG